MKFFRESLALAIVAVALFISGCERGSDVDGGGADEHNMAVTYYTVDGAWQLVSWNEAPLAEGTLLYIDLDRKERRFEIWDNFNSMYPTMSSGSFLLSVDDMDR
jgi:hypothetical protein